MYCLREPISSDAARRSKLSIETREKWRVLSHQVRAIGGDLKYLLEPVASDAAICSSTVGITAQIVIRNALIGI